MMKMIILILVFCTFVTSILHSIDPISGFAEESAISTAERNGGKEGLDYRSDNEDPDSDIEDVKQKLSKKEQFIALLRKRWKAILTGTGAISALVIYSLWSNFKKKSIQVVDNRQQKMKLARQEVVSFLKDVELSKKHEYVQ